MYAGAASPPSVIVVSIDTLRADHLSSYGYRKIATRHIDSYADGGTRFSAIATQVPLTLPSHTVLFTSTYPFQNRVEENAEPIPVNAVTLASVLHERGYATAAFIGSVFLEKQMGLDRGFDVYDSPFHFEAYSPLSGEMLFGGLSKSAVAAHDTRDGALVVRAAEQWLGAQGPRPVFAFVHLFDLHEPYRIPAATYRSNGLSGYDAELEYVDRLLGSLRQALERSGLWSRSLVIVLSDHGEGLEQHGEESHGYFVYQSTLWVPLLVHWPAGTGAHQGNVSEPAGLIDVAPTILEFLHIAKPASFVGRSLLPETLSEANEPPPRIVYSETMHTHDAFGWAPLRSVRMGSYKYIDAPKPELYDLSADPDERTNLNQGQPERMRQLRLDLAKLVARYSSAAAPRKTLPGAEAALGSLGYLASGPEAVLHATGPDPKDRLPEYREYRRAMLYVYDGKYDRAIPILEQLLADDPKNVLARRDLGASYLELRQYAKARQHLAQVVTAAPGDYMAHYELGVAEEHLGQLAAAKANLVQACMLAPEAAQCQEELARVLQKQK